MTTDFKRRANEALGDSSLRTTVARSTTLLRRRRQEATAKGTSFEQLQSAARSIRSRNLAHLPDLLAQLEEQVLANGVQVFWAEDAAAANRYIVGLAEQHRVRTAVNSQSFLSREMGLASALQAVDVALVETQLGDYILQLSDDRPSHRVFGALHWRKEDVAALFEKKLDMPETLNVQAMSGMVCFKLRKVFAEADLSVGALDFSVAQTGSLVTLSNSGNDRYGYALAPIHVAIMGIDQVVSSLEDVSLLAQVKTRSASGQAMPTYLNLLHRPSRPGDPDGPVEVHLVILDNGRGNLIRWGYGDALGCIGCGACLNACPVYREVGGRAYGGGASGPIGAVTLPLMPMSSSPAGDEAGDQNGRRWFQFPGKQVDCPNVSQSLASVLGQTPFADLPFASTLCGACADVCPVGIDLPQLLIKLRSDIDGTDRTVKNQQTRRLYAWATKDSNGYRSATKWLTRLSRPFGRETISHLPPPFHAWVSGSDLPAPAQRSFRERWAERTQDSGQAVEAIDGSP
ncbi:MAG: LUD domain-containing protein [Chloroflexota bacterium]|nr:LUD domain-containing protein [Chloroflexota bacterium]